MSQTYPTNEASSTYSRNTNAYKQNTGTPIDMSPPFLQTLPREIRDLIYADIFAGPDGTITLIPWSPEVAQSLSILRSCKQIHRECKDIIWKHKGMSLREFPGLASKLEDTLLGRKSRLHLNIQLEVLDWDELEWVERSLAAAARSGSLEKLHGITIKANKERPQTIEEYEDFKDLRENGETIDGRLFKQHPGFSVKQRYCTWMINTSWPPMSTWAKRKWLAEMLIDTANSGELLLKIHNKLGGQLYVDKMLCLLNGKQLVKDLKLDPRDGEITIIPRR